jgi:hypothetical protein
VTPGDIRIISPKKMFASEQFAIRRIQKQMEYSKFSQIVLRLKKNSEVKRKVYKLGIDLIEFDEDLHKIINLLISEVYGEQGLEWFQWFCWESDFGEKDWSKHPSYSIVDGVMVKTHDSGEVRHGANDENGNPICHSIQSTWEYLEENHSKEARDKSKPSAQPNPNESVYGC